MTAGGRPEKYTEEFVEKELKLLLDTLRGNPSIIYIGELFEYKDYSRSRYGEWIRKYADNKEIQELSCTIKDILETRAVKGGMEGDLNSTMTIFHLKNNYNWIDKKEIDQKQELILKKEDLENMSDDELLELSNT